MINIELSNLVNDLNQFKPYVKNATLIEAINVLERVANGGLHYESLIYCQKILWELFRKRDKNMFEIIQEEAACQKLIWNITVVTQSILNPINPIKQEKLKNDFVYIDEFFKWLILEFKKNSFIYHL